MISWKKAVSGVAGLATLGAVLSGPAVAQSASDWTISYNFAVTSDYVFRGVSQSAENPTIQAGADIGYKIFYVGVWGSGVDFGKTATNKDIAWGEIDIYAGIKPVVGPVTFDFGVIYYTYPNNHSGPELNYVELKAGASGTIWRDGTLSGTIFWSPDYTGETGNVWTFEGTFAQALPKFRDITPTFSATLGYQLGDSNSYTSVIANGDDSYLYWNAGLTLGFHERFSVDFRYWDSNISDSGGFCTGKVLQCDERFVATAKVTY